MSEETILKELDDSTRNAAEHQMRTLQTILERNAGVRYLVPHFTGYSRPIDAHSFRRFVPISSYDDYVAHIQDMADGDDRPILSVDPLVCFFYRGISARSRSLDFLILAENFHLDFVGVPKQRHNKPLLTVHQTKLLLRSSGTNSLKPKLIPYFDSKPGKEVSNLAHQAAAVLVRRLLPPRESNAKILWFLYPGNVTETKGGIKVMAATAFPFHNNSPSRTQLLSMIVSPMEVLLGSDTHQQMYCHLLCGLRNSNSIDGIRAPYAAGLMQAFRLLESKWVQLCDDIENGSVSSEITDVTMRDAMVTILSGPQPDIANRIRSVCGGGEWGGILIKLWPQLRYISSLTTGSMEQCYPKLEYYAGPTVTLLGGDYFASECCVAINMERTNPPGQTKYIMLPTAAYFEFLPFDLDTGACTKDVVDFSGVEVGNTYEVVATTYRGLYRYRLGDVVKVIGFYNSSPVVEYVMRAPKAPGEVLTEKDLISAMERFRLMLRQEAKVEVVEYASFLDLESNPKHVVIFLKVEGGDKILQEFNELMVCLQRCCLFVEGCFGSMYKVQKNKRDVGPLEIAIVRPGSFDSLQQSAVENGAPANQFKPPKILRNHKLIDLLKASVVVTLGQGSQES